MRHLHDICGVAPNTIRDYLGQVRRHRVVAGECVQSSPLVSMWLKHAASYPRPSKFKEPAPVALVNAIVADAAADPAVKLAVVLCWFSCLRMGSIVQHQVGSFDAALSVLRCDVTLHPSRAYMSFNLKSGKTDVHNRGGIRYLMAAQDPGVLCPVEYTEKYLHDTRHLSPATPLLQMRSGRNVTRDPVVRLIKQHAQALGLDPQLYAGHSLRTGAATTMGGNGVSAAQIAWWGGWASVDMAQRYTRGTFGVMQSINEALQLTYDRRASGRSSAGAGPSLARWTSAQSSPSTSHVPSPLYRRGEVEDAHLLHQ